MPKTLQESSCLPSDFLRNIRNQPHMKILESILECKKVLKSPCITIQWSLSLLHGATTERKQSTSWLPPWTNMSSEELSTTWDSEDQFLETNLSLTESTQLLSSRPSILLDLRVIHLNTKIMFNWPLPLTSWRTWKTPKLPYQTKINQVKKNFTTSQSSTLIRTMTSR